MRFVRIDEENASFVDAIDAGPAGRPWVHVNSFWREHGERLDDVETQLIHVDEHDDPVGIIAFGQHYADEDLTEAVDGCGEVIHLVIDHHKHGQGYGRQATLLAIERLREDRRYRRIVIAHHPDNLIARSLYESLGFVEFGRNDDGDALLELRESAAC